MSRDSVENKMEEFLRVLHSNAFTLQRGPVKVPLHSNPNTVNENQMITLPTTLEDFSFSNSNNKNTDSCRIELKDGILTQMGQSISLKDWDEIFKSADNSDFSTITPASAQRLLKLYSLSTNRPFPISYFTSQWKHPQSQLRYLQSFAFNGDLLPDVIEPLCSLYALSKSSVIGTLFCILQSNPAAFPLLASIDSLPTIIALGKYFHYLLSSNNFFQIEQMLPLFSSVTSKALSNELQSSPTMQHSLIKYLSTTKSPLETIDSLKVRGIEGVIIGLMLVQDDVISIKGWASTCGWAEEIVRYHSEELKKAGIRDDIIKRAEDVFGGEQSDFIAEKVLEEFKKNYKKIGGLNEVIKMKGTKEYEYIMYSLLTMCDKSFQKEEDAMFIGSIIGEIIDDSLLPVPLVMHMMRCVINALRIPGNQFEFGISALKKFIRKLRQWKLYGRLILSNKRLQEKHPELVNNITARSDQIPYVSNEEVMNRINEIKPLNKEVQQIMFSILTLAKEDLKMACSQFVAFCRPKAITSIAEVIVYPCLSRPELIPIYLSLIQVHHKTFHSQLQSFITQEVNRVIKKLLSQQLTPVDAVILHRSGTVIGKVTLANNYPVLTRDLYIRELLEDSLSHTWCCDVLLFVIRLLKEAKGIFNKQNPWMSKLLSILRAVYEAMPPSTSIHGDLHKLLTQFPTNNLVELKVEEKRIIATTEVAGELLDLETVVKRGISQVLLESYYSRKIKIDENINICPWVITPTYKEDEWKLIFSVVSQCIEEEYQKTKNKAIESVVSMIKNTIIRDTKRSPREICKRCICQFVHSTGKKIFTIKAQQYIPKRYYEEMEKWRNAFEEKMNENELPEEVHDISLFTIIKSNELWKKWIIQPQIDQVIKEITDSCIKESIKRGNEEVDKREIIAFDDKINQYLTQSQLLAKSVLLPYQQSIYDDIEIKKDKYQVCPNKKEHPLFKRIDITKTSTSELNLISKSLDAEWSYNLYVYVVLEELNDENHSLDIPLFIDHICGLIKESVSFIKSIDSVYEGLYWILFKNQSNDFIEKQIKSIIYSLHSFFITSSSSELTKRSFYSCHHKFLLNTEPLQIPTFSFYWIEFITPSFILNRVEYNPKEFTSLLVQLLKFIVGLIRNEKEIPKSILLLYSTTLRLFAILRHDYSNYLASYFIDLIQFIPYKFGQLRSIILTSTPSKIPFSMNIAFNENESVHVQPLIHSEIYLPQQALLDIFISSGEEKFLPLLLDSIQPQYYLPLCVYLAIQREDKTHNDAVSLLLYYLVFNLPINKRNDLLNAMVDNLRYANSHTLYYSVIIQMLFSSDEIIAEQIITILIQRLLTSKPLQLGVLVTFMEIMNVKRYDLLNKKFMKQHQKVLNIILKPN
ncbi:CCR4-not transcription complex, putative [Entamoeba histolytica HM-3:IMSS]|uniref:CCR4-not transcription complex, putative n=1 Tax=Entamoeba histolytica HM-3:IMSS TaxID=885315 RepID=M7X1Z9_ENTHI|nr:CCR4-not transcription complex, putative [Entamoeba histolytica HM-3:IMSS]